MAATEEMLAIALRHKPHAACLVPEKRELFGEMTVEDAERAIVTATLRFAKRQMTWFRHQAEVRWFAQPGEAHEAALAWLDVQPLGPRPTP